MAYPTIACDLITNHTSSFPAFTSFNQVNVYNSAGVRTNVFACSDKSHFLPAPLPWGLSSSDLAEIWPLLLGILVIGFLARMMVKAFSSGV